MSFFETKEKDQTGTDFVELYLGRDPTSVVAEYFAVDIPANTEIEIYIFPVPGRITKNYRMVDVLSSVFGKYLDEYEDVTQRLPGRYKLFFKYYCRKFEPIMKNVLARLCELNRYRLKCKVTFNQCVYVITPTCVHPPVPLSMSKFNTPSTTTPRPSTATLLNWFLRILAWKNRSSDHPYLEFIDETCDQVDDDVFTHLSDLLNIQESDLLQNNPKWFRQVLVLKKNFSTHVCKQSGFDVFVMF